MEIKDAMYVFNGDRFLDFIDTKKFKNDVAAEFDVSEEVKGVSIILCKSPFVDVSSEYIIMKRLYLRLIWIRSIIK